MEKKQLMLSGEQGFPSALKLTGRSSKIENQPVPIWPLMKGNVFWGFFLLKLFKGEFR